MTHLQQLKQKRATLIEEGRGILNGAKAENRDLTEAERAAHTAKLAEVKSVTESIEREEAQSELERTVEQQTQQARSAARVSAAGSDDTRREPGIGFARFVQALAVGGRDNRRAAEFAETVLHDAEVARALGTTDLGSGGALIPQNFSSEFIEFLRPASVVRRMGARVQPMPNGNDTIMKMTAGSTASYIGDNTNIVKTEPTFGQVQLQEKHLAALVPYSNNLLRTSSPSVSTMIREDLVAAVAMKEDETFLRSDGTSYKPKGLRYWVDSANVLAVNATVNLANIDIDLGKALLALQESNCRMITPGWIVAPRTFNYLESLRDGNGNKAFPELAQMRLRGFPISWTTQIPTNLAVTGTGESEIYLADFADVIVGDNGIEVTAWDGGAYVVDGAVVSGLSQNQTVIRIIAHHDLVVRHAKSVAVLKDVDWA